MTFTDVHVIWSTTAYWNDGHRVQILKPRLHECTGALKWKDSSLIFGNTVMLSGYDITPLQTGGTWTSWVPSQDFQNPAPQFSVPTLLSERHASPTPSSSPPTPCPASPPTIVLLPAPFPMGTYLLIHPTLMPLCWQWGLERWGLTSLLP